jgi:hypothetical protein
MAKERLNPKWVHYWSKLSFLGEPELRNALAAVASRHNVALSHLTLPANTSYLVKLRSNRLLGFRLHNWILRLSRSGHCSVCESKLV